MYIFTRISNKRNNILYKKKYYPGISISYGFSKIPKVVYSTSHGNDFNNPKNEQDIIFYSTNRPRVIIIIKYEKMCQKCKKNIYIHVMITYFLD